MKPDAPVTSTLMTGTLRGAVARGHAGRPEGYRSPVADVVLPVLDEVDALPWVLGRMPAGYRPIVVDNGSTDGSADVAARLGAEVVIEHRRGFGAACFAG